MERRTRHVWMLAPLGVGEARQGFVLTWRRTVRQASPPIWEAYVLWVDERREDARFEWVPAMYLVPVETPRPGSPGSLVSGGGP